MKPKSSITLRSLVLLFCALLVACLPQSPSPISPTATSTTATPVAPLSGPKSGTTMAWTDGSTLIFVADPNGQDPPVGPNGFWITLWPISNYQFSLCVQSGNCTPPTGNQASKNYNDTTQENFPVSISEPGQGFVNVQATKAAEPTAVPATATPAPIISNGQVFSTINTVVAAQTQTAEAVQTSLAGLPNPGSAIISAAGTQAAAATQTAQVIQTSLAGLPNPGSAIISAAGTQAAAATQTAQVIQTSLAGLPNPGSAIISAAGTQVAAATQTAQPIQTTLAGLNPVTALGHIDATQTAQASAKGASLSSPAGYCGWIGGRSPTDSELNELNGLLSSVAGISSGGDHPQWGGFNVPYLPTQVFDGSFRCVVDHPRPSPAFSQSSPYYAEAMYENVTQVAQFCQNGRSYATLDFSYNSDSSHSFQSANVLQGKGECQAISGGTGGRTRVVCDGASNTSLTVAGFVACNGITQLRCQPGSTLGTASCSNNMHTGAVAGMDDWEFNGGVLVPASGGQLPGGTLFSGPITHQLPQFNGVMVTESHNESGTPGNGGNLPVCPIGYYFDTGTQGCASLGAPTKQCLDGYSLNGNQMCTSASGLKANYPGCPTGQVFDPYTGTCDSQSTFASANTVIHQQLFTVNFQNCAPTVSRLPSCSLSPSSCIPLKKTFDPSTCSCK